MAGRYIGQAQRVGTPLTFVLVDVDHFKKVNTRFGHLTGDVVLAEVATLLKSSVRGSDAVVRYGGDEFLIILANTTSTGATNVLKRITDYLEDWNHAGHLKKFELKLTMGLAEWKAGQTLDEMLDAADRQMYAGKQPDTSAPLEDPCLQEQLVSKRG
jgi:diguanylate cyclase (GGDEF)-like protein